MKLYVGNLSYETTNATLEDLFATFGSVRSAQVIQDRDTGRSKGFGFVEMSDDNAARAAIEALNDKEHDGRRLAVNEAPAARRPRWWWWRRRWPGRLPAALVNSPAEARSPAETRRLGRREGRGTVAVALSPIL